MPSGTHKDQNETGPTLLALVLQLHGEFRRKLEPIRVTPLQAGVILFLRGHANATLTDVAITLGVKPPTLSEVVGDLVRKRWVTRRRSGKDRRALCLSLSRRGETLALHIDERLRHVEATLTEQEQRVLGRNPQGSRA